MIAGYSLARLRPKHAFLETSTAYKSISFLGPLFFLSRGVIALPWVPEVFFSLGATELSGEAAKESLSPTSTTRSEAPRRWRARRPLASRVS